MNLTRLCSLAFFLLLLVSGCDKKTEPPKTTGPITPEVTELKIEDLKLGTGAEAVAGKRVTVRYAGWLTNGTKFDASTFTFLLGDGEVIAGWDKGIAGMKVGGQRKLIIPPKLAYGRGGSPGVIPPDATLMFEVELLGVK
jgi:FKBP-type peptidyl-prolyl cis-trans isomerase